MSPGLTEIKTDGMGCYERCNENGFAEGCRARVVNAPADAADGHIAVFDGTGGKALKDSGLGAGDVWHAGNDGPGSGLDADTLDGYEMVDLFSVWCRKDGRYLTSQAEVAGTAITNSIRSFTNSGRVDRVSEHIRDRDFILIQHQTEDKVHFGGRMVELGVTGEDIRRVGIPGAWQKYNMKESK